MGCDIHAFPEYRVPAAEAGWNSIGGEFHLGRLYSLFGLLAGVRTGATPVYRVRGLPGDVGYTARRHWWLRIVDDAEVFGEHTCTRTEAARWIHLGLPAPKLATGSLDECKPTDDLAQAHWVTCPGTHTPSWLNAAEFATVLDEWMGRAAAEYEEDDAEQFENVRKPRETIARWRKRLGIPPAADRAKSVIRDYRALLGLLRTLEADGCEVRVVFWFDS